MGTKKTIKELQARVEAAEEELDAERQRSDLAREMEQLGTRLEEAGGATAAKAAHNKKRESEINKMHADVEEINISNESVLSNLKRKQGNAVAGLMEEIDAVQKIKAQVGKDKTNIMGEISDLRAATDEMMRAQANQESQIMLWLNNSMQSTSRLMLQN